MDDYYQELTEEEYKTTILITVDIIDKFSTTYEGEFDEFEERLKHMIYNINRHDLIC